MEASWKTSLWNQFGAAIDMLENAIVACPESLWADRSRNPEFWYVTYHTLFWLDYYCSDSPDGFAPPAPFGLEEMDPTGVLPPRVYTKSELLAYLAHCRAKCRAAIESLSPEKARGRRSLLGSIDLALDELYLYNMRHVQHGAGQLNLILRQTIDSAPRWVRVAGMKPGV
jgi:hypothetical protein